MSTTTCIVIMAVCLMLSAYFSATETAFSSANTTRLKTLAEKGNKRAALVCKLLERYDRLLSTILIGNNIVNIATASIGTVLFVKHYGDAGATISTVVVTVVVLIFGEISPKSIAKDSAENCAMLSAPVLQVLIWVFTPLNAVFSLWKKLLAKVFRLSSDNKMSQEELLMLVDEVQQDGSIDQSEGELLKNAIDFSDPDPPHRPCRPPHHGDKGRGRRAVHRDKIFAASHLSGFYRQHPRHHPPEGLLRRLRRDG